MTHVLVIDADAQRRGLARAHCAGVHMWHVDAVDSIDAALSRPPADVIFLDINEPREGHSFQFDVARLREGSHRHAGLAMTAPFDALDLRVAAARAGADLFLVRPLGQRAMHDAIRQLLDHRAPQSRRILVVDDDPSFVDMTTTVLEHAGYSVAGLHDPMSLLDALRDWRPDLVLVDFGMPRYDGIELTSMMRSSNEFDSIPVLFVSGRKEPAVIRMAFAAGCDDFLAKPIAAVDLLARIDARIERTRQLRAAAQYDALTGLLNRAAFQAALDNRVSSSLRNSRPLSLCLIDLDRFKRVNDVHGHQVGDEVLAAFGRLVRAQFRAEDLKCRWGGEEFALAFPEAHELSTAHRMVEELRQQFHAHVFQGARGDRFRVNFSAGVAQMTPELCDTDGLIRCADSRLYQAKRLGRARVVSRD